MLSGTARGLVCILQGETTCADTTCCTLWHAETTQSTFVLWNKAAVSVSQQERCSQLPAGSQELGRQWEYSICPCARNEGTMQVMGEIVCDHLCRAHRSWGTHGLLHLKAPNNTADSSADTAGSAYSFYNRPGYMHIFLFIFIYILLSHQIGSG